MLPSSNVSFWPALIANLASLASFIGLYVSIRPPGTARTPIEWALISAGVVLGGLAIVIWAVNYQRNAPKKCRNQREIIDFMAEWIKTPGRVSIFSRDMSWANDGSIPPLLHAKAAAGELILHLKAETQISKSVKKAGAAVHYYGESEYVPQSRFTIVRYGQNDASVAIGTISDIHTIYRFRNGHPVFALARDLTDLVERVYP